MAIRLNLLAEARAAEDMRRRDPVKRSIWVGGLLAILMLAWSSSLQLKAMVAKRELSKTQGQMSVFTNDYKLVVENQRKTDEIRRRTAALDRLTAERFLHANVLNALQLTTVEDVQLLRYRVEQIYSATEGTKPKTNDNRVIPGKSATATERITVVLEAIDSSPNPGDQITKFKETASTAPYFRDILGKTNVFSLKQISQPQMMPVPGSQIGRSCVMFTLESKLLEKTR